MSKRFLVLIAPLMLGFFVAGCSGSIGPPAQVKSAVDQTQSFVDNTGALTINHSAMMAGTVTTESLTKESVASLADIYLLKNLKETTQMTATSSSLVPSLWSDGQPPVPVMEVPFRVIIPDVVVADVFSRASVNVPIADLSAGVAIIVILPNLAVTQQFCTSLRDQTRPITTAASPMITEKVGVVILPTYVLSLNRPDNFIQGTTVSSLSNDTRSRYLLATKLALGSSVVAA
jgi:hypothetical protein